MIDIGKISLLELVIILGTNDGIYICGFVVMYIISLHCSVLALLPRSLDVGHLSGAHWTKDAMSMDQLNAYLSNGGNGMYTAVLKKARSHRSLSKPTYAFMDDSRSKSADSLTVCDGDTPVFENMELLKAAAVLVTYQLEALKSADPTSEVIVVADDDSGVADGKPVVDGMLYIMGNAKMKQKRNFYPELHYPASEGAKLKSTKICSSLIYSKSYF